MPKNSDPKTGQPLQECRIMVVDDDQNQRFVISHALKKAGFIVTETASGEEALAQVESFAPELILLDIFMPGIDGFTTCHRLKNDPNLKNTLVIMLSGLQKTPQQIARSVDSGADGFIKLPVAPAELVARVNAALRIKRVDSELSQEQLFASTQNWNTLFNSIGQLCMITDTDYNILEINNTGINIADLNSSEIIGKKCFTVFDNSPTPNPECPLIKTLQSGKQESGLCQFGNLKRQYLSICTPVTDATGKIVKTIHIANDISDLKESEAALLASEEKYLTLFNATSDAILLIDVESLEIIDANDSAVELYGYSRSELLKLRADDLSSKPELTGLIIQTLNATTPPLRYHRKKDGSLFPAEIKAKYLTYNDRKTNISSIRDISSRVAEEKRRQESEKHLQKSQRLEALGTLAGGIAHDFNNILSVIMGFTELSLLDLAPGSPLEDNLLEIDNAGKRARDLVQNILMFARPGDEKVSPIEVGPLIKEVSKFLRSSLPSTIEIVNKIEYNPIIFAAPIKIHQILMNLSTNAGHAMENSGGRLEIELRKPDIETISSFKNPEAKKFLELKISDTGAGISKKIIDSIFEPYFTTKKTGKGTGLGLAMVHGIVTTYGGHIQVFSEPNQGTTFHIYLPISDEPQILTSDPVSTKLATGSEKILVVDDELQILEFTSQLLVKLGYQVTTTDSPENALQLLSKENSDFALLITDMTMPQLTGFELATKLRQSNPEIPVILCSGYSNMITPEKIMATNIKALLNKPLEIPVFANTVREVLDEASQLKL